jgi:peptide/nickel transport system permease protein
MTQQTQSSPLPGKITGGSQPPPETVGKVLEMPLWRVRLEIFLRGLRENFKLFARNPIGLVGLVVIFIFFMLTIIHPILIKNVWDPNVYDPVLGYDMSIPFHPAPPSAAHLLGTDPLGRDILSQIMWSTRSEFILGLTTAFITVIVATTIGAISAYYGGLLDMVFMRFADLIIMTPVVTILIVLSALLDLGLPQLALVLGLLGGFGGTTIIIKSQALTIKVRTFIEAARIAGGDDRHIIFTHIVPNLLPLSFLYMMFSVTGAIFSEAVLSFFGLLNIRMSWGLMIYTASYSGYLLDFSKWWLVFPASISISLMCAAFYLVGRAMDEIVNPRLRKR